MKLSCPIVDTHASWIALNPIHGCPFRCRYCFLNGFDNTSKKPVELCSTTDAVKQLLEYKFYNYEIPLCLFTSTEIFSTESNINYAMNMLIELNKNKVKNPIIFITKCFVPDYFIKLIKKLEKDGMTFIFMLSYSNLSRSIEIGIDKEKIKENFINLKRNNIKVIHYWRPFLPENSSDENIDEVIQFVKKYSIASVAIGLKVQESFVDKLDFWDEIQKNKEKAINSESVWSSNAYEKIYLTKHSEYPIFRSTSCAISYCLKKADYNCYYGTKTCELNNCPKLQKQICKDKLEKLNETEVLKYMESYNTLYNNDLKYKVYFNDRKIILENKLSTADLVLIKYNTSCNIEAGKDLNDHYWSTSHKTEDRFVI